MEGSTIGLDLAKNVFQAHGANSTGEVVCRKKLRRERVLPFLASQPRCTVAMEACASRRSAAAFRPTPASCKVESNENAGGHPGRGLLPVLLQSKASWLPAQHLPLVARDLA